MFLGQRRQQHVIILQFDVKICVNDNLFEEIKFLISVIQRHDKIIKGY